MAEYQVQNPPGLNENTNGVIPRLQVSSTSTSSIPTALSGVAASASTAAAAVEIHPRPKWGDIYDEIFGSDEEEDLEIISNGSVQYVGKMMKSQSRKSALKFHPRGTDDDDDDKDDKTKNALMVQDKRGKAVKPVALLDETKLQAIIRKYAPDDLEMSVGKIPHYFKQFFGYNLGLSLKDGKLIQFLEKNKFESIRLVKNKNSKGRGQHPVVKLIVSKQNNLKAPSTMKNKNKTKIQTRVIPVYLQRNKKRVLMKRKRKSRPIIKHKIGERTIPTNDWVEGDMPQDEGRKSKKKSSSASYTTSASSFHIKKEKIKDTVRPRLDLKRKSDSITTTTTTTTATRQEGVQQQRQQDRQDKEDSEVVTPFNNIARKKMKSYPTITNTNTTAPTKTTNNTTIKDSKIMSFSASPVTATTTTTTKSTLSSTIKQRIHNMLKKMISKNRHRLPYATFCKRFYRKYGKFHEHGDSIRSYINTISPWKVIRCGDSNMRGHYYIQNQDMVDDDDDDDDDYNYVQTDEAEEVEDFLSNDPFTHEDNHDGHHDHSTKTSRNSTTSMHQKHHRLDSKISKSKKIPRFQYQLSDYLPSSQPTDSVPTHKSHDNNKKPSSSSSSNESLAKISKYELRDLLSTSSTPNQHYSTNTSSLQDYPTTRRTTRSSTSVEGSATSPVMKVSTATNTTAADASEMNDFRIMRLLLQKQIQLSQQILEVQLKKNELDEKQIVVSEQILQAQLKNNQLNEERNEMIRLHFIPWTMTNPTMETNTANTTAKTMMMTTTEEGSGNEQRTTAITRTSDYSDKE